MLEQSLELIERAGATTYRNVHEKTLFALAQTAFSNRDFNTATKCYEQALPRYPTSPSALFGRYQLAECYRRDAREFQRLQPSDALGVPNRYRGSFSFPLEKAAVQLQILVDDLQARQATAPLAEGDARLLMQARFTLADCRCGLGAYSEAIPLYSSLANQYDQRLEGLLARKQLYFCYVMEPEKPGVNLQLAQHTLKEMRQTLEKLDESAFQSRPEAEQLAELKRWLNNEEKQFQDIVDKSPK